MHIKNTNDNVNTTTTEAYMLTSDVSLTAEEEDAIITLVVVVVGIIIIIMVLFSMGIFIDCKHQKTDSVKKRKLTRLKMPPLARRNQKDEVNKAIVSDMYPNANDTGFKVRDVIIL